MATAYECDACGLRGFDSPCWHCGSAKVRPYEAGAPAKAIGFGSGPPPFKRHYSFIHGRQLNSWDEYRRANRELGIVDTGQKPANIGTVRKIQVRV